MNKFQELKKLVLEHIIVTIFIGGIVTAAITDYLTKYDLLNIVAVVTVIGAVIFIVIRFFVIGSKKELLIVEDSENLVGDLKTFFLKYDINVTSVKSVQLARYEIENRRFHFVLIDLELEDSIQESVKLFCELLNRGNSGIEPYILSGYDFNHKNNNIDVEDTFRKILQSEVDKNVDWKTLKRNITSRYFSKNNVQDLMHLVREIQRIH